jgi:hypothetical protein
MDRLSSISTLHTITVMTSTTILFTTPTLPFVNVHTLCLTGASIMGSDMVNTFPSVSNFQFADLATTSRNHPWDPQLTQFLNSRIAYLVKLSFTWQSASANQFVAIVLLQLLSQGAMPSLEELTLSTDTIPVGLQEALARCRFPKLHFLRLWATFPLAQRTFLQLITQTHWRSLRTVVVNRGLASYHGSDITWRDVHARLSETGIHLEIER